MSAPWTEDEKQHVRTKWTKGFSASQISRTVSAIFGNSRSRNAVIGQVHRMGLAARATPTRPVKIKRKTRRAPPSKPVAKAKPKPAPAKKPEPEVLEPEGAFHILDLKEHQCRWPVTKGDDHRFCGRSQAAGSSYCRAHLKRSISPLSAATLQRAPVSMKKAMS